ncbi:MAG: hypothetical protein ACRDBG_06120, partial [Waterburya sp.]
MTRGYGSQVITSTQKPFLYNTDLIAKVAMQKQSSYDQAYAGLEQLKKQALDIRFLNEKEQGKVDDFNKSVSSLFDSKKGEFGDLSRNEVLTQYTSLFDKVGRDVSLISRYKKDQQIQKQIQDVELKRSAKDPAKAGFNNINYQNYISRIQDYSKVDLDTPEGSSFVVKPYVDYVDYNKELSAKIKQEIPIEKIQEDIVQNGYVTTVTKTGRDPNKVRKLVQQYFSGSGGLQLQEESEHMWRQYKDNPETWQSVYNDHVKYNLGQKQIYQKQLSDINAQMGNNISAEQRGILSEQKARIESELGVIEGGLTSPEDFFSRDKDDVVGDISAIYKYDKISGISSSAGGYAESRTVKPDKTYLAFEQMKQKSSEFRAEMAFKGKKLEVDTQMEIMKEQGRNARDEDADGNKKKKKEGEEDASPLEGLNSSGMSESLSEPVTLNWKEGMREVDDAVKKSYVQAQNILQEGVTHGNVRISAENVGLDFIANPKLLDNNPVYNDNVYLQAAKYALDEVYKNRPDLSKYIGSKPKNSDSESWGKQREVLQIVQNRVNQIIKQPANPEEARFSNELQTLTAQRISLDNLMVLARKNGNPEEYLKKKAEEKNLIYANARYNFDLPDGYDKDTKAGAAANLQRIYSSFESSANRTFDDVSTEGQIRGFSPNYISSAEIGVDGTVQLYFKPSAFEKSDDSPNDPNKNGPLNDDKKFIAVKDPSAESGVRRVSVADIKKQGYFSYKDPKFASVNMVQQLALEVDTSPQRYWDAANDQSGKSQSVSFEIRRSGVTESLEANIMGTGWVNLNTRNAGQAMAAIREKIRKSSFEDLQYSKNR